MEDGQTCAEISQCKLSVYIWLLGLRPIAPGPHRRRGSAGGRIPYARPPEPTLTSQPGYTTDYYHYIVLFVTVTAFSGDMRRVVVR